MDRNLRHWERRYLEDPSDTGAAAMYGKALQRGTNSLEGCEQLVYWLDDTLRIMGFEPSEFGFFNEEHPETIDYSSLSLNPETSPLTLTGAPPYDQPFGPCNRVRLIFEPQYNEFEFYCISPKIDSNTPFEEYYDEFRSHVKLVTRFTDEDIYNLAKDRYSNDLKPTYMFAHLFGYDTELPEAEHHPSGGVQPPSNWRYGSENAARNQHPDAGGNLIPIDPMLSISYTYTTYNGAVRDFVRRIITYTDFILEYLDSGVQHSNMRPWVEAFVNHDGPEPGIPTH